MGKMYSFQDTTYNRIVIKTATDQRSAEVAGAWILLPSSSGHKDITWLNAVTYTFCLQVEKLEVVRSPSLEVFQTG